MKDRIFLDKDFLAPFAFNHSVAEVFDDMAERSIPLYRESMDLAAGLLASQMPELQTLNPHAPVDLIDLGCSTGSFLVRLMGRLKHSSWEGTLQARLLDQSPAMLQQAEKKLNAYCQSSLGALHPRFEYTCADLNDWEAAGPAQIVVCRYTLQFLKHEQRSEALKKIYDCLLPGGLFLLSEKLSFALPSFEAYFSSVYEDYKVRLGGYTPEEVERKKRSLATVMHPVSFATLAAQVQAAGFTTMEPLCGWNQFHSWILQK